MKKLLGTFCILFLAIGGLMAQQGLALNTTNQAANLGTPNAEWYKTDVDLGDVVQAKPVKATFTFTNSGTAPLVVTNAKGSCGCTSVVFPQEPLLPGKSANIVAEFDAKSLGVFKKTITVYLNTDDRREVLHIGGVVVKE